MPAYSGGAYGKLDRKVGFERHHMPADSVNGLPRSKGPSIQMEADDHALTSSYGNSRQAQEYRDKIQSLIESGNTRDAMAQEVKDVRNIAGSKYNKALQEMLDYAKKSNYLNK
jgi:hypothetical protein